MGLKHFYIKCSLEILDVVANQTALANALSDEEPARDLSDNNGVHSDLLHGGLEIICLAIWQYYSVPSEYIHRPEPI